MSPWQIPGEGWCWVGRDDFHFFWNFITAIQILPCVIETQRYGYILVSSPIDDLCIDIWISAMIICLRTQMTKRQGTAMY